MLDFAVLIKRQHAVETHKCALIEKLPLLRSATTHKQYYFEAGALQAWAWHTSVKPYSGAEMSIQAAPRLRLFQGYAMTDACAPVQSINEIQRDDADRYGGDFLLLEIEPNGHGRLIRSRVSNQQVYYGQNERWCVIASRASIAAVLLWETTAPPINPNFMRWVCSYGVCSNTESLFRSVRLLRFDQSIHISPKGMTIKSLGPGFLVSNEMKELYRRDRKAYWDVAFDRMLAGMKCLELSKDPIEFPLSGGKDSRLLLGLLIASGHQNKISRVYTNGPSVSPEVRAANDVCKSLQLHHEHVDGTNVVSRKDIILSDKLLTHLLISEAEVSPMDLFWQRRIHGKTTLHGQEGGLRNIAGKRTFSNRQGLFDWLRRHLGNGDMCGIYKPGVAERNLSEIESFIDEAAAAGVEWSDIPSLHRVTYRVARWVSRTWKAYNELGFAPYVFVNADVISTTFNAGHESRMIEEFHFEMFRRINPKLVSIPFAGQQWEPEMIERSGDNLCNPTPYQWPNSVAPVSQRPTHEAFYHNIDSIISFIGERAGSAMLEVVDVDKLRLFGKDRLQSGHYQPLWQTLQGVLAELIPDWTLLADPSFVTEFELPNVDIRVAEQEAVGAS
jgi:hypothetical protein